MKKSKVVKILLKDICKGRRISPFQCPIALAIKRTCRKGNEWVLPCVQKTMVTVNDKHGVRVYPLPKKAMNFIHRFDRGLLVKPFTFVLRNPVK